MNLEDTSITKWFKIKNKDYVQSPRYFYYDGKNAMFLTEINLKYKKIGITKWREYDTNLIICCCKKYYNQSKINFDEYHRFSKIVENKYNNDQISILKSNLQKCIRRSLVKESISTALTLLCIDPNIILRRLPIIMLEDVKLNSSFLDLIWLMCAVSKGFNLNDSIMEYIIFIVYVLAKSKSRDSYDKLEKLNIKKLRINDLSSKNKDILWAIQLRKSFGGMKGDIKMLNFFTKDWYDRFNNNEVLRIIEFKKKKINLRLIRYEDINLSAIDFHCSNIVNYINNKYKDIDKENIKKAIWFHRSSFNNKSISKKDLLVNNDYLEIWNNISNYVNYCSKLIIKNNFS